MEQNRIIIVNHGLTFQFLLLLVNTINALNSTLMILRLNQRLSKKSKEISRFPTVQLNCVPFFLLSYSLGFILSPHQKLLLSDIEKFIERGELAYKSFQSHFMQFNNSF